MIVVLIVFHAENQKKGIWWKQYHNETVTRQRQDSVTVRNLKARKINTPLSLPIHQACCLSDTAFVVVFNPLDASSILRRIIRCRCCYLCAHLPPLTPPSLSYITWACRLSPAASIIVSDSLDASRIPRPLPTSPSSLLSHLDRLTLLKPLSLLSTPSACKHTGASAVGDVHSDVLYFLFPQLTPPLLLPRPRTACKNTGASAVVDVHSYALYILLHHLTPLLSSSIPRDHLPLPTPPSWLPIPKARHCDTAATAVVPESMIPWTNCLLLVLGQRLRCRCQFYGTGSERLPTFGLLTSYLFLWRFAPVNVGHICLPNLVGDGTVENRWGAKLIPGLLYKEYTSLWFEFDLCG